MNRFSIASLFLFLVLLGRIGAQSNFQNVTETSGIVEQPQLLDRGDPGIPVAAWFDYNNDGLLDLLVGSPTIGEEFKLFHNRQSLFEDVTQEAGMMSSTMHGAAIGDYDNDGYVDLYLTRGTSINVLLRNRGDGTFEDVTLVAGVAALSGQDRGSSSFVDYDNDGDLDLFVGDYIGADMLFQNQGDGTFNNVAEDAGITGAHNTTHHMFGDYNNDGFMDLFIAHNDHNRSTPGILYRNEKNGRFTDVTLLADITESVAEAEGVLFMDFNNDGWLDLFITTGHHGPFGLSRIEENLLYRNSQSGTFSDVTRLMRVQGNTQSSGVMAGDYDNDGWADIFVSNSRFNHLFRNESGQVFARMDTQSGIVEEGGVGAVGFGDYNTDGFLDLFLASLKFQDNAGFETPGTDILYQNQGNPNNWIQVELVGIQSNRSGIGARLQVVANDLIMIREVSGGNGYGGETLVAEFGLSSHAEVEFLDIRWPSGEVDVFTNVGADQKIRIFEGREDYQVVRPVQWVSTFPESIAVGEVFSGQATIRPELFEQSATVSSVKLTGLGEGREVLLPKIEDGTYVLDDDMLVLTGEQGSRRLSFVTVQQTSLGMYQTALSVRIVATPSLLPSAVIGNEQIDFGEVEVERSGRIELTIYNEGMGTLIIERVNVDVPEISVLLANASVSPGDSTQVVITFRPQIGGAVSGTIDLRTNDLNHETIRLSYTGSAVVVPADPRADFDGNGQIAFGDFLIFVQAFGSVDATFDLDGSGRVDFSDFLIFVQSFGKSIN